MPYEFLAKNGLISQGNITATGSLAVTQNISASATGSFGIVGIGITSPTARLHVNGSSIITNPSPGSSPVLLVQDNGTSTPVKNGTTLRVVNDGSSTDYSVFEASSGVSDFVILNSGNVGIGTTNPTTGLYLSGSYLTVDRVEDVLNARNIMTMRVGGTAYWTMGLDVSRNLVFSDSLDTSSPKITIRRTSGNVGIGTTTPNSKLEVAGTAGTAIISVNNTTAGRSGSFGIDSAGVYIRNSNDGDYFDLENASGTSRFRLVYDNNTFLNTTYTSVGSLTSSGSKLSVFGNLSVGSSYGSTAAPSNGAIFQGGVGIGTTNPYYAFDVYTNSTAGALMSIRASGSANARIYFDAANGDLTGGDYCYIGQESGSLNFVINTDVNSGNIHIQPRFGSATDGRLIVSGSSQFGRSLSSYHQFTGSVNITGSVNASSVTTTTRVGGTSGTFLSYVTPGIYANGLSTGNAIGIFSNTTFENQAAIANIGLHQITSSVNDITAGVYMSIGGWHQASATGLPVYIGGGYLSNSSSILSVVPTNTAGAGNVGIGTRLPGYKLDVNGDIRAMSGSTIRLQTSAGQERGTFQATDTTGAGGAGLAIATSGGEEIAFKDSSDVNMVIKGTGRVGIGTITPAEMLHISSSNNTQLRLESGADAAVQFVGPDTHSYAIGMDDADDKFKISYNASRTPPGLGTNNRLVIDTSGNVGIDTTNPTVKLQVGTQVFGTGPDANYFVVGNENFSGPGPVGAISGYPVTGNRNTVTASIFDVVGGWERINGSHALLRVSAYDVINSTPALTVLNNGNVGIGTTSSNSNLRVYTGSTTPSSAHQIEIASANQKRTLFLTNAAGSSYNPIVASGDSGIIFLSSSISSSQSFFIAPWSATAGGISISGSGQVGIGTSDPKGTLHVIGSSIIANNTSIDPDSYANTIIAGAISDRAGWGLSSAIGGNAGTGHSWAIGSNGANFYMGYGNASTVDSLQTFLQVSGSRNIGLVPDGGNVGIGMLTPTAKLYVEGGSSDWNETTPGTSVGTVHLDPGVTTNNYGNAITFGASDSNQGQDAHAGIYVRSDGGYGTKMYFATTDSYAVGSKTRMFIGHDGRVGIGTTGPAANLQVSGSSDISILSLYRSTNSATTPLLYVIESGGSPGKTNVALFERLNNLTAANVSASSAGIRIRENSANYALSVEDHSNNSYLAIKGGGNVGIGIDNPTAKLQISGSSNSVLLNVKSPVSGNIVYVTGSGAVGINTATPAYTLQVNGSFAATTKSFVIDHPTKPDKKLVYGSLESPYHGIRLTGRDTLIDGKCVVELPDYISKLVLPETVNIQLTGIKCNKVLYVDEINIKENNFTVAYDKGVFESYKDYDFFWDFTAIRADVPQLQTEI